MFEQIILGSIQGIVEWLPVSSEGMILLCKSILFQSEDSFEIAVQQALFLHLGTFLAALLYFYKDVKQLVKTCLTFPRQSPENRNLVVFLLVATVTSGILGLGLIQLVAQISYEFDPHGRPITTLIGLLLIGTGLLALKAKPAGLKNFTNLKLTDGVLLGIVQGFAALPGFSRSGLTVSALLLCQFDKTFALKLSFLMSLPIVLGGNIVMHAGGFQFSTESLAGLAFSFIFGLATIHMLLKTAEKINFGLFVILFGFITILSTFI